MRLVVSVCLGLGGLQQLDGGHVADALVVVKIDVVVFDLWNAELVFNVVAVDLGLLGLRFDLLAVEPGETLFVGRLDAVQDL